MKPVIYQIVVRYFGNTNTTNQQDGTIEANGCGKFADITETALQALKDLMPGGKVEVLDMVEEGDRVAARMQFSGIVDGRSVFLSTVAIYRFVGSRIAEDWGIGFRGEWPERVALPQAQVANQRSGPKRRIGSSFRRIPADQGMPHNSTSSKKAQGDAIEQ